ncbi:uncharacterized protein EAE97_005124 [Botrytis byssoidea]|uniref:Uncharacterized protein n=1 Tax=Botrytis byssoidea TaxID=139641 RepID=A0A9P5M0I2_9HELO|nr:uncharacterized protein EAE97_005124 [Botrytis byssoidea]KAF7946086.1 hypothetical protein EAE97_005124 [Botrytis byssoidea]
MPPKRKAASSNSSSKAAKATANATPASSTDIEGGDIKFSSANTSTDYDEEDEEDDEDEDEEDGGDGDASKNDGNGRKGQNDKGRGKDLDLPNPGETLSEEWCSRVSDMGFPLSQDGVEFAQKLDKERDKRNQDHYDVHLYNDFNGYGSSEAVQNFLKDFNRDIYKKTISPYNKWAYIEALAVFFKAGGPAEWMSTQYHSFFVNKTDNILVQDNSDGLREEVGMIGIMVLTSFEMLSEHKLFSADSEIKNIPIICPIILEFLDSYTTDLFDGSSWQCEVVRLCDQAGIDLSKSIRKQVDIDEEKLTAWRQEYKEKKENFEGAEDGDGYKFWAEKSDWRPEDDLKEKDPDSRWMLPTKNWYRWDWKTEYQFAKANLKGGNKYDLSKVPKSQLTFHNLKFHPLA